MGNQEKVRIGAVNYLNTKPLVFQLDRFAPQATVTYDLPSRLADQLAAGELDVALIPSIELFQHPHYEIVSDACIGCYGPVLSVKLFSRTPIDQIRVLALDEGSRTSIALVQILLDQQYNVRPDVRPLPIGTTIEEVDADAALLIGDRAMHSPPGPFHAVWDLGDEWLRWTGLPFVFALWTAHPQAQLHGMETALAAARDAGVEHLAAIARDEAASLGLTQPQCFDYLRDNLKFYFGAREQQGLELFYNLSQQLGLAPSGVSLAATGN